MLTRTSKARTKKIEMNHRNRLQEAYEAGYRQALNESRKDFKSINFAIVVDNETENLKDELIDYIKREYTPGSVPGGRKYTGITGVQFRKGQKEKAKKYLLSKTQKAVDEVMKFFDTL
jgi:hypothetical protein